jgi:hypothetical protein
MRMLLEKWRSARSHRSLPVLVFLAALQAGCSPDRVVSTSPTATVSIDCSVGCAPPTDDGFLQAVGEVSAFLASRWWDAGCVAFGGLLEAHLSLGTVYSFEQHSFANGYSGPSGIWTAERTAMGVERPDEYRAYTAAHEAVHLWSGSTDEQWVDDQLSACGLTKPPF